MKKIFTVVLGVFMLAWITPFLSAEEGHEGHDHGQEGIVAGAAAYTCPMHPEVVSDSEGICPDCGMSLEKKAAEQVWDSVSEGTTTGSTVGQEITDVNNETCPVSEEPVSGKNFSVYNGKRYSFCCDTCIGKFNKNPEKYITEGN